MTLNSLIPIVWRTKSAFDTENEQLTIVSQITGIYCESHTNHINTLSGKIHFTLHQMVNIITTLLLNVIFSAQQEQ